MCQDSFTLSISEMKMNVEYRRQKKHTKYIIYILEKKKTQHKIIYMFEIYAAVVRSYHFLIYFGSSAMLFFSLKKKLKKI